MATLGHDVKVQDYLIDQGTQSIAAAARNHSGGGDVEHPSRLLEALASPS